LVRIPEGKEKEKGTKEILETIITENFPKLMRHQTTDSGSSENTKQDKYFKNSHQAYHIQTAENQRDKILQEAKGRKHLT